MFIFVVPPSDDFLLLREFRSDNLPGLIYSVYPPKQASSTTDFSSIGQKNPKKKASVLEKFAVKTIKKAGIDGNHNGEVDIVLQIIEVSQERVGSNSTGELLLWSYTPEAKTTHFQPIQNPENPNEEIESIEVIIMSIIISFFFFCFLLFLISFSDCNKIFLATNTIIFQRKRSNAKFWSFKISLLTCLRHSSRRCYHFQILPTKFHLDSINLQHEIKHPKEEETQQFQFKN